MGQADKLHRGIDDVLLRRKQARHSGDVLIITRVNMSGGGVRSVKIEAADVSIDRE